jgi:hypothetical protein
MRVHHLIAALVLIASLAMAGRAEAGCADDMQELQARVDRQQAQQPTPQSIAAAKVLQKFNESTTADEVDCYNALARARHALDATGSGTTLPEGPRAAEQQQPRQLEPQPQQLPQQQPLQQQ